jgi:hypothetical protein
MKKNYFILALLCQLLSTITAQTETTIRGYSLIPNEETMQLLNSAEYIFEGVKTEWKCYYNADSSKIYTSSKTLVEKVYKGNLVEGQIVEQIREGGLVGNDFQEGRGPKLGYKHSYIFLCKKTIYTPLTNQGYDVPVKLSLVGEKGYLDYAGIRDFEMFGLNHRCFKTKKDFEDLLLKVEGNTLSKKSTDSTTTEPKKR